MDVGQADDRLLHEDRPSYTFPHSFRLPEESDRKLKAIAQHIAPPGKKANTTAAIITAIDNAHAEIAVGTLGALLAEHHARLLLRAIRDVVIGNRAENDDPLDEGDRLNLYEFLYRQLKEPAKRWQREMAVISAMDADRNSPPDEEEWAARRRRAESARKVVETEYPLLPKSVIEAYEKEMLELGSWPPSLEC